MVKMKPQEETIDTGESANYSVRCGNLLYRRQRRVDMISGERGAAE